MTFECFEVLHKGKVVGSRGGGKSVRSKIGRVKVEKETFGEMEPTAAQGVQISLLGSVRD